MKKLGQVFYYTAIIAMSVFIVCACLLPHVYEVKTVEAGETLKNKEATQ